MKPDVLPIISLQFVQTKHSVKGTFKIGHLNGGILFLQTCFRISVSFVAASSLIYYKSLLPDLIKFLQFLLFCVVRLLVSFVVLLVFVYVV